MDWMLTIPWPRVPEEEREAARHLDMQFMNLNHHEIEFGSAVALFDHVSELIEQSKAKKPEQMKSGDMGALFAGLDQRATWSKWAFIAANHAALTVYHFQSTLRSIRDRTQYVPSIAAKVDTKQLQEAFDRFHREFPSWKYVRDWVAHFADKLFKPEDIEENRAGSPIYVHSALSGRRLIFTRKGEEIGLDVTAENLALLRSVKEQTYEAFRKACEWPSRDQIDHR